MADSNTDQTAAKKPKSIADQSSGSQDTKPKYYRTKIAALAVEIETPAANDPEQKIVRFTPFYERWDGDRIKVGYLATDNPVAIAKLDGDFNIEAISADEFNSKTDTSAKGVELAPF